MFETPWTVEHFIDPSGDVLVSMGRLWLELARSLADSVIIPFGLDDYALFLGEQLKRLETQLVYLGIDVLLGETAHKTTIRHLGRAISEFHYAARNLQQLVQTVNSGDKPLSVKQVEMVNSRLVQVERAFILDYGVFPERHLQRHSVFAVAEHDLGANTAFALVLDPVAELLRADSEETRAHWTKTVQLAFTKLQYTIETATQLIQLDGF